MCVLLLRGPQTPGELRGRTERMHRFEELPDVLGGLQKLMDREPSLAPFFRASPAPRRHATRICFPAQWNRFRCRRVQHLP